MSTRTYKVELNDAQMRRINRALIILDAIDPPTDIDNPDTGYLQGCFQTTVNIPRNKYNSRMLHGFAL